MTQIYNFSAGPAVLPKEVLQQASEEMLDWHGSGMSVMEMSHRGKEFISIAQEAEADLRELMGIPANYKVLFLQGGAHAQFSMIPMNLLRGKKTADYLDTGIWAQKAIEEASRYCEVNIVASAAGQQYRQVPQQSQWKLNPDAAFLHYTSNETIGGLEMFWTPRVDDVPLVVDMSSHILSRPVDVSQYGLIYAGAQKNIGPAGLTIVIVREDLIGETLLGTPTMFDYKVHADNESMYNTPPTYGIYIAGLVFKWLKAKGGLAAIEKLNIEKSALLYDYLDSTDFYNSPIALENRSRMNIPFTLKDSALDAEFLKQAQARGLLQLKGHRLLGGMRASIYNAMPLAGVQALVGFMQDFERAHG
ncbi:3-phosphoserine/phosphohydroxythreonine transaminase [Methylobacillus flagellatus]|uniref:3-phosphoserine/phosphohydroxythreonine transaminase n=1 Tax=Methylobacillus flagellatus TaxID=405 RepID=UPI002853B999|nr:3-phosphoserine/phosphohydroxythreonine transaminase [Methylobacillus flagellatus]MDR5171648.1 3-phosphoserine/phosphohydroxythreonine transaminase [Methylobacillus flagellatus]